MVREGAAVQEEETGSMFFYHWALDDVPMATIGEDQIESNKSEGSILSFVILIQKPWMNRKSSGKHH